MSVRSGETMLEIGVEQFVQFQLRQITGRARGYDLVGIIRQLVLAQQRLATAPASSAWLATIVGSLATPLTRAFYPQICRHTNPSGQRRPAKYTALAS